MASMARIFLLVVLLLSCVWLAVPGENVLLRPLVYPTPAFSAQLAQQTVRMTRHPKEIETTTALAQSLLVLQEKAHALRVLATLSEQATARVHFLVAVAYAEGDETEAAKSHITQGLQLCKEKRLCTVDDRVRLQALWSRLASTGESAKPAAVIEIPLSDK